MRYIRLLTPFVIVILVISLSLIYGQATVSSSAAGGWDAPTPISDSTWDYPRFLSMNDDTTCVTALLPYSGSGDNNRHVVVSDFIDGAWQPSTVIAENGRFSQDPFQWLPQYTHPVMSGNGSTIAYVGWTGETFGVYIVDRLSDGGWSAPTLLNAGLANVHYWISLSQDGKTLALASYSFFGVDHVYVTTRGAEGWSALTRVSAESGPLEGGGMPALSGDGKKLVYIQNARVTFVQRVNGQWSQPVQITQNNHWEGDSVDYPQLSRDGRAVFYWLVQDSGSVLQNQDLYILRWNGSGWSAPQQVNTGPVIPITDVSRQPAAADSQATRLIFSRPITISEPGLGDVVIASHLEMAEWRDGVWQESRVIEAEGVYNHWPRLSPDGRALIFVGGSSLWQTRTSAAPPLLPLPTSTGALIPVAGGNLFSEIDQTGYLFAPGTFTETVIFTHTIWSSAPPPPPGVIGLGGIGHAFEATALSAATSLPLQPTQPVTVTVDYGDSAPRPIISGTLCLWWMDANHWVRLPSQDDPIERRVTATVDHFSRFALFGETHSVFLPAVQRE